MELNGEIKEIFAIVCDGGFMNENNDMRIERIFYDLNSGIRFYVVKSVKR